MHALDIIVPILGMLAIAYRYDSAFIAARIMMSHDTRATPGTTSPLASGPGRWVKA
jgi:carbon starvation protein CstA